MESFYLLQVFVCVRVRERVHLCVFACVFVSVYVPDFLCVCQRHIYVDYVVLSVFHSQCLLWWLYMCECAKEALSCIILFCILGVLLFC